MPLSQIRLTHSLPALRTTPDKNLRHLQHHQRATSHSFSNHIRSCAPSTPRRPLGQTGIQTEYLCSAACCSIHNHLQLVTITNHSCVLPVKIVADVSSALSSTKCSAKTFWSLYPVICFLAERCFIPFVPSLLPQPLSNSSELQYLSTQQGQIDTSLEQKVALECLPFFFVWLLCDAASFVLSVF